MNFQFRNHLDVWPVLGGLYERRKLFTEHSERHEGTDQVPSKSLYLRAPEDQSAENWLKDMPIRDEQVLTEWGEMQDLLKRVHEDIDPNREVGRVMLAALKPQSVIAWHLDCGPYHDLHERYHVALITNPLAYLYSSYQMQHIPAGALYWFNNKITHTAGNWGIHYRIHLIVDMKKVTVH